MAKKKSLKAKLTWISRSKQKTDKPVYQRLIGIESKIEYHPFLEDWGHEYQSLLPRALNDRQKGISETEIEKSYHKKYNGKKTLFSWDISTGTTGQVEASLRDIVADIVRIGESYECPIACEDLDFSKKKATLRHSPKKYNRMLSGFIYDKFRAFLVARAEKYGIEVIFKNPFATSVIGMVKYMPKYGLNSAFAAAMVIAKGKLNLLQNQ